jgi:hypothetical protein
VEGEEEAGVTQTDLVTKDFRRVLSWSGAMAGPSVLAQLMIALASWAHVEQLASYLLVPALILSFLGGLACLVLFLASLLAYRFKGLWFAVPVIAAWALPMYFILTIKVA